MSCSRGSTLDFRDLETPTDLLRRHGLPLRRLRATQFGSLGRVFLDEAIFEVFWRKETAEEGQLGLGGDTNRELAKVPTTVSTVV